MKHHTKPYTNDNVEKITFMQNRVLSQKHSIPLLSVGSTIRDAFKFFKKEICNHKKKKKIFFYYLIKEKTLLCLKFNPNET